MPNKTQPRFPKGAIGRDILKAIPTSRPGSTVAEVVKGLSKRAVEFDTLNYVYVIDGNRKPLGVLSIKELMRAKPSQKIKEVAREKVVAVHPYTSKERAAMLAIRHNIKQLPVVDKNGVLVGVFGSDDVISTLHEQHVEDILYFSGVTPIQGQIKAILKAKVGQLVRMRMPWLIVGLAGGIAATFVISFFESALREIIALAFFIPVIVYMGDAVGHQTQLIFIRSLGSEDMNLKTYLLRELAVDFVIGVFSAIGLLILIEVWLGSPIAASIVGLTMFINVFKAGIIAIGIPLLLFKLKKDPALGSGPFTTTIQDLLSIIIYFLIAGAFL